MKFYAIFSISAGGYVSSFCMDKDKRELLFSGPLKKFERFRDAYLFLQECSKGDPPARIAPNPKIVMSEFEIHQFGVVVRTPINERLAVKRHGHRRGI